MKRICKECGREFEITSGEINFYKSKNLELPKRCKSCRDRDKNRAQESHSHKSTKNKLITAAILFICIITTLSGRQLRDAGSDNSNDNNSAYYENDNNKNSSSNNASSCQFRSDKYLTEHFEKHGGDFNYSTKEEYLAGANNVISSSNALHKIEKEDGDDVYYLEETNEFVIVSTDGYIRTYFKPEDGIKYYNRQ